MSLKTLVGIRAAVDIKDCRDIDQVLPHFSCAVPGLLHKMIEAAEVNMSNKSLSPDDCEELTYSVKDQLMELAVDKAEALPGNFDSFLDFLDMTLSVTTLLTRPDPEGRIYLLISVSNLTGALARRVVEGEISYPELTPFQNTH